MSISALFPPMPEATRRYLAAIDRHTQAIGAGTVDGLHQALTDAAKIAKEVGKTKDYDSFTRAASELCGAWETLATWEADQETNLESEDMAGILEQSSPRWYAAEDRLAA